MPNIDICYVLLNFVTYDKAWKMGNGISLLSFTADFSDHGNSRENIFF